MRDYIILFIKGIAMGAANVIPGVSGGTIALITNIYEDFIGSIKSFDLKALKLLFTFKFNDFAEYVNLRFIASVLLGVSISIISLGKLLDYLFIHYEVYVWAYFFGLILASIYYVSLSISKWNIGTISLYSLGAIIALSIAFLNPASQNDSFVYLIICGIAAVCSMILPGLSGSFVLILMGNYQLIFLDAIPNFKMGIIIPVAIGGMLGLILLSHLIAYLLKEYKDRTISLLAGFILGSLLIIWPWKEAEFLQDEAGIDLLKHGEKIINGYDWLLPSFSATNTYIALAFMLLGVISIIGVEKLSKKSK